MADPNQPPPPQNPAAAQYGEFPPPPPGPPPSQQHPAAAPHDAAHTNPLDTTHPTQATDEETRQQQELLDHYQREHQQRLSGQIPASDLPGSDDYRPPQPPRPTHADQQQQQYTIPAYNPADPAFAQHQHPSSEIPQDAHFAAAAPPPAAGAHAPVAGGAVPVGGTAPISGGTSPVAGTGEEAHKSSGWGARFANLGIKAAAPINQLAHKLGSQSFLPETMPKECDKAASILQSFCKSGVYADPNPNSKLPASLDSSAKETSDGIIDPTKEKPKQRVIVTIPPKVIARAVGLAIFTTLRAGFNVTGATGSGILIARLEDGSWGPPSGIQVHSVGGGFSIGVDIYDCVCVINSREALEAFTKTRVSLGSDLAVTAGPYGAGGAVEVGRGMDERRKSNSGSPPPASPAAAPAPAAPLEPSTTLKPDTAAADKKSHRRSLSANSFKPVFSYVKSRGFYAGIRVDGTVVVERKEANAAFYGAKVSVDQIIKGHVPLAGAHGATVAPGQWPAGAQGLLAALRNVERGAEAASPGLVTATNVPAGTAAAPGAVPPVAAGGSGPAAPPPAGPAFNAGPPSASGGLGGAGAVHKDEELPGYDERLSRPAEGDYKYA